jgi:hypothetical protein
MDSDLLNFMLKVKGGRGLQNFSHLWDMVFGYWWGILSFLFLLVFVVSLAGFSTLGDGLGMSDFPSFFLDLRLYLLGLLLAFSPLLSSFI